MILTTSKRESDSNFAAVICYYETGILLIKLQVYEAHFCTFRDIYTIYSFAK